MGGVLKGVSIRGLEVFEALAQTGSVGEAARRLGMSAPAVSQQLKNLNHAVGIPLLDQSRRPMTLTPGGRQFLRHVEAALGALRAGQRDLTTLDLSDVSSLRIGVIEDFENEVTPALTVRLAETMENCVFRLNTGASHVLLSQVAHTELDLAICAEGRKIPPGAALHPLLEDPYILAVPKGTNLSGGLGSLDALRFLRRDQAQVMGQQIEESLTRQGLSLANRFELDSNQSISALVAGGHAWTITTPLSLLRAGRFLGGIDAHPLPFDGMARRIVLCASSDWTGDIPRRIAESARDLINHHFILPGLDQMPWLKGRFVILQDR
ncbi:LysR family transcriptional regulator [Rhodobacteraceae bacterium W635]|uniref:LysR family transcriptional regulator n=1 Tax=Nioella halotolerans TaxID=2303578 RepID=UPI000E3DC454|nr:LysR family transcriptional regulator [Rhodobacteraceae bacterium W635]